MMPFMYKLTASAFRSRGLGLALLKPVNAMNGLNGMTGMTGLKGRNISQLGIDVIEKPPHIPSVYSENPDKTYDPKRESLEEFLNIRFGPEMPTINDDKKPERDLVNFPRCKLRDFPDLTRLYVIPDSWFQYFYNKTGVTGPYVFGVGFITFLFSKEIFIIDHDFPVGLSLATLTYIGVKKFGPKARQFMGEIVDEELDRWKKWQPGMIDFLNELIDTEKKSQESAKNQSILFDAKRENVAIQIEAEFRRRQMLVYEDVRKRLDYLIAKTVAEKQYQQQHMVNWIIENVAKSITPQQEKEALNKCLLDLKQLSSKHQIAFN